MNNLERGVEIFFKSRILFRIIFLFAIIVFFSFMLFRLDNLSSKNILDVNTKVSFISLSEYIQNYFNDNRKNVLDLRDLDSYFSKHLIGANYFNIDNIFFTYNGIPNRLRKIQDLIYDMEDMGLSKYNNFFIYSYSNDYLNKDFDIFVLASILYMIRVNGIYIIENPFEKQKVGNLDNNYFSSDISYLTKKGYLSFNLAKTYLSNYFIDYEKLYNKKLFDNKEYKIVFVYKDKDKNLYDRGKLIPNSIELKLNFNKDKLILGSYLNNCGINKGNKIILYSYDLKNSLFMFFVIKAYMGYSDVYIYEGGLLEWINKTK